MRYADGSRTDVGRGRPENEDNLLVLPEHGLYAVADGMGGHRAGEVASATAVETLKAAFLDGRRLDEAVAAANAAVFARAAGDVALRGMGTTLTAVAIAGDGTALLGHVGDSRGYLMRGGTVTRVTDDHSVVEQLVREGKLTPEEARNHPQRAIITRALGIEPEIEVDTYRVELEPGDRLLICSDGLSNMLSDDTIAQTLRHPTGPQQAADALVDLANQAGGDDNITVVVLDALGDHGDAGEAAGTAAGGSPSTVALNRDSYGSARQPEPPGDRNEVTPPGSGAGGGTGPGRKLRSRGLRSRGLRSRGLRSRGLRSIALWGLPIVAVIGIAVGAVGWYARRTYFVGLSTETERVTLFKGVPGGMLGWDPTTVRPTDLTAADLTEADRSDLASGHRFASLAEANRFLERLQQARDARAPSGGGDRPVTTETTRGEDRPVTRETTR